MHKVQILECASYLPKNVVMSVDLFEDIKSDSQYGIPIDWMSEKMGIKERRLEEGSHKPSDAAILSAQKLIEKSDIDVKDIDMVIFCGIERDRPEPATAHTIACALGINASHTYDVSNACFGFMEAMKIASKFIETASIDCALIVTAEVTSNVVHAVADKLKKGMPTSQAKKYIGGLSIGDAGGCVLLGRSLNGVSGFELFNTKTLSKHVEKCYYNFNNGEFEGEMKMDYLAALMLNNHNSLIDSTLDTLGWEGFDFLLSHQIGKKPYERISEIKGFSKQQNHIKTFDYLGNIASATFPVNYEKLMNRDTFKPGSKIGGCFAGSGIVIGQFGYTA